MKLENLNDQKLANAIIERGILEESALSPLVQAQKESFKKVHQELSGRAFLIEPATQSLVVRDLVTQQEAHRLQLSEKKFDAGDWESFGDRYTLVSSEDGTHETGFKWDISAPYGLVVNRNYNYLYNQGQLNTEFLALTQQAVYGGVYKGKPNSQPFDLTLSKDNKILAISDRGAGSVLFLDTESYQTLSKVDVRSPESVNTLNIAIHTENKKAYITDNQGTQLSVVDIANGEVTKEKVGLGILGNLVLNPEQTHLYLLTIKPNQSLVYLNLETLQEEKSFKLKGDLFKADSSDPYDILAMSPDESQLLCMTYLNDPRPFTPVITVIETATNKTVRRYSIKDETKPCQLTFSGENPFRPHTKTLSELILDNELMSAQKLWELKRELRLTDDEEEAPLPPEEKEEEAPAEAPEEAEKEEQEAPSEAPKEDDGFLNIEEFQALEVTAPDIDPDEEEILVTPKQANKIELGHDAFEEILDILKIVFYQKHEIDLVSVPEAMVKLREHATKAREELERFDSVVVQIDDLHQGQGLRTVVLRDAVVMMVDLKASIQQKDLKTVPQKCPNCSQPLMGSWDCDVCGFELESPERARKRRIASVEATAHLPPGHFLIPDPQGLRIMQVNPHKYVVWNLDPDQISCEYPLDVHWLPNKNLLVVDRDGNKLVEMGMKGKLFWSFDTTKSERHALMDPVKATYYVPEDSNELRFLIVDQGHHRILEVDKHHNIHFEYGDMGRFGESDGLLNAPTDVQFTHEKTYLITDQGNKRVLEINEKGEIERTFGKELNLTSPVFAQRLFNNNTVIIDAGTFRIVEVNPMGDIVSEFVYYRPDMEFKFRLADPIKFARLPNKDFILINEDKVMQIIPAQKKLIWFSRLDNLTMQPEMSFEEKTDADGNIIKVLKRVDHGDIRPVRLSQKINFKRMQRLIADRIKNDAAFQNGEEKGPDASMMRAMAADRLRSLMDARQQRKKAKAGHQNVETFNHSVIFQDEEAKLSKIRPYCIDRHHNGIVRINRKGEVIWHYGFEVGQVLSRPNHIHASKRTLVVADTGHNRVIEISRADKEVILELKGPEGDSLSGPKSGQRGTFNKTLVADQKNKRLVEFDSRGKITWEFKKDRQISAPQYVEELENGHILFTDSILNSVRQIDRQGNLQWSYGSRIKGRGPGQLFAPEFATRLPNGNTLIADTRNNRVIEVEMGGKTVWEFEGKGRDKVLNPTRCDRLKNGNTLITYNNHRKHIEVTFEGKTVWSYHMGNDVFLPAVEGDGHVKYEAETLETHYNAIEKRLVITAQDNGYEGQEAHIKLMDNVLMKSVRASLVLMAIEKAGTVLKTFPAPEDLLADRFGNQIIITFILNDLSKKDTLTNSIKDIGEIEGVDLKQLSFQASS